VVGVGGELDDVALSPAADRRGSVADRGQGQGVGELVVLVVEQQPEVGVGAVPGQSVGGGAAHRPVAGDLPGAAVETQRGRQSEADRDPRPKRHHPPGWRIGSGGLRFGVRGHGSRTRAATIACLALAATIIVRASALGAFVGSRRSEPVTIPV
jgi:hypothetical protein